MRKGQILKHIDNSISNFHPKPKPNLLGDLLLEGSGSGTFEQIKLGSEVRESQLVLRGGRYGPSGPKSGLLIEQGRGDKKTNLLWSPITDRDAITDEFQYITTRERKGNVKHYINNRKKSLKMNKLDVSQEEKKFKKAKIDHVQYAINTTFLKRKKPSKKSKYEIAKKDIAKEVVHERSEKYKIAQMINKDAVTNEVLKQGNPTEEDPYVKLQHTKWSGKPDQSYLITSKNEVRPDTGESGSGEVVASPDGKMRKYSAYNVIDQFMFDNYEHHSVPIETNHFEIPQI